MQDKFHLISLQVAMFLEKPIPAGGDLFGYIKETTDNTQVFLGENAKVNIAKAVPFSTSQEMFSVTNAQGNTRLRISSNRVDVFYVFPKAEKNEKNIDEVSSEYKNLLNFLFGSYSEKNRVNRMGAVGEYMFLSNEPGEVISEAIFLTPFAKGAKMGVVTANRPFEEVFEEEKISFNDMIRIGNAIFTTSDNHKLPNVGLSRDLSLFSKKGEVFSQKHFDKFLETYAEKLSLETVYKDVFGDYGRK